MPRVNNTSIGGTDLTWFEYQVFMMHKVFNYTIRDTADALNSTRSTVYRHLLQAESKLLRCCDAHGTADQLASTAGDSDDSGTPPDAEPGRIEHSG